MERSRTFSESWHRVASQKIFLRPGVEVQRQQFRGERWIVLRNVLSNQFFRLRPEAYEFVARLQADKTVEEVWQECLERFPDEAPGQEAVVQLLAQLYHANLLQYQLAADAEQLFQRQRKRQQAEMGMRWLNIMFMRFPLLDPDRFLVRTLPWVGRLISPAGFVLWLAAIIWGGKVAIDNSTELMRQSEGILAPGNLIWLYLGMVIVKTIHEFGHAYFCRKFGGEVHTMGVMLMIFTPMPFVDASSSSGFRERKHRMLVGAAGMIVELFVAALATVLWAKTAPGVLHSVLFNMMFVASVSTLLFNLNPLMRFDGYYIFSDWLEIPNLNQRATGILKYWIERHGFGVKNDRNPARSRSEAGWLGTYGVTALVYRTVIFAGIIWFIADQWLLLGLLMAVACLITWLVVPAVKLVQYLASNPKLERTRSRAIAVVAGTVAALLILLGVIPFPHHFRASGVIQAKEWSQVIAEAGGEVAELLAKPGQTVRAGQPLVLLANPELALELAGAKAQKEEVESRLRAAMQRDSASVKPLEKRLESSVKLIQRLEKERENLVIRARHAGVWIAPGGEQMQQRWLKRGTPLGLVVNPAGFEFSATVLQEDVNRIFQREFPQAEVRLPGEAGKLASITQFRVVPGEQQTLPSPALGWAGGGDVAVNLKDQSGQKAVEPFFSVVGQFQSSGEVTLLHGRTGKVRFELPSEPLLPRWFRRLGQMLQKRFQF
ncbi:MAG: biotin/lipoyl-binding protein [Verrucomicrobia bacterium]|nr:biotin/lipoyl-binding protein [Verrucomicrobiota bacterium]